MNQVDYCIRVLWIHGATIGEIHQAVGAKSGKTKAAIRGIVDRAFEKPRAEMTKDERQSYLNSMRIERLDEGILDISHFIAKAIREPARRKSAVAKPEAVAVVKKKMSRKEQRKHELSEQRRKQLREPGFAPRGSRASPLENLFETGLLAEPEEKKSGKVGAATVGNATRRYHSGERLRSILVSAYSSGLKTQNYEAVGGGGGGAGVVIHAAVVEALENVRRLREMIFDEEFRMIDEMLRTDMFVWEVPAPKARDIVLEDIRRVLDTVSVLFEMMAPDDFLKRWGFKPYLSTLADGKAIRRSGRKARDAIAAAQRKVG